jgi:NTE family protein
MSMDELRAGTALALSGGGFRAALFHVGSLIRLNELGLLPTLVRVSSVSGGSITAGRLAVAWNRLRFENGVATNLTEEVVAPVRGFCGRDIDKRAVALGVLSPFRTIGDVLSDIYDDDLLENTKIQSLPDAPRFVFNATNLQTGRLFRISKPYMADYRIVRIDAPDLPVARCCGVQCVSAGSLPGDDRHQPYGVATHRRRGFIRRRALSGSAATHGRRRV